MNDSGVQDNAVAALVDQFGRASLVVIFGVLASWVLIKRDGAGPLSDLPDLGVPVVDAARPVAAQSTESLLDRAELAFAAGRVVDPEYDNALAFYKALKDQDPGNAEAEAGVERVIGFLLSQGEGAIYRGDWAAARSYATTADGIAAGHAGAQSLKARAEQLGQVNTLTARALAQFSAGRLTTPAGNNASETYKQILKLDPQNATAKKGLASVAERLVANAQSAVIGGNTKQADALISQAKALNSDVPGIPDVERSARQWKRIVDDGQLQQDLTRGAEALQADRLMWPDEHNAFVAFSAALERSPSSDAARRGLDMVRQGLIDRAWRAMGAGNLSAAASALAHALEAGAPESTLVEAREELGYQQRLADARAGKFERLHELGKLEVLRRETPEYPRVAEKRELEGMVVVEFTVDELGKVRDPLVTQSSNSLFDRGALSAINRWEFNPVVENGRPVPVRTWAKFVFKP